MEIISTSKNWKARLEDIAIQVFKSKGHDVVELTDGVVRRLEDSLFLYNLEHQHCVQTTLAQTTKGNYILVIAYDKHTDDAHKALFNEIKKEHNIPAMVKSMLNK